VAQVLLVVNGRDYQIACEDGEEEHIAYLAQYINHHVDNLVESVGQVGEARLLLMAALVLADELSEAYSELDEFKTSVDGESGEDDGSAALMQALTERLELVAARIESA
jgi:cell division protein ZapA